MSGVTQATVLEIESLKKVQRQAAAEYRSATTKRQRDWHMLGIADYLMEEVLIMREEKIVRKETAGFVSCVAAAKHG
jgi:hypothetical protein